MTAVVRALLAPLGGIAAFVKPGMRVLVKPNLVTDRLPGDAATTHPEVVRAVVRELRAVGCTPVVGDSPFSAISIASVWERTGMAGVCDEEGVQHVSMEQGRPETVHSGRYRFALARAVIEADAVINVPKVKTHAFTVLTCGVKNLYGAVPGFQKAEFHKTHANLRDFCGLLRAIEKRVAPVLTIADGITGMHGEGPTNGEAISLGVMLAAPSAVVLDHALAALLKVPTAAVPYLTSSDPAPVWLGEAPTAMPDVRIPRPRMLHRLPQWLVSGFAPLFKVYPVFSCDCIRCGRCVKGCPVDALRLAQGMARPVLGRKLCIGCCCCHEGCPVGAVSMRMTPLMRLISGAGKTDQ